MMTITLNGQQRDVPEGITVRGLLEHLHIQPERVAVELNLDVVRKKDYESIRVQSGDAVEVVSFMGGGSFGERKRITATKPVSISGNGNVIRRKP